MKKILVVDDSETMLKLMQGYLTDLGCEVVTVSDSAEGVRTAQNDPDINFIIADIHMPNMSGLEMCAKIRAIPHHKNTIMVMCTTEGSKSMQEKARELGIACWLLKPIQPELLKKAVKVLYERMGIEPKAV